MGRADVKVTDDFWEEIHDEKERVGGGEGVIAFYSCDYVILRERETLILEKTKNYYYKTANWFVGREEFDRRRRRGKEKKVVK